MNIQFSRAAVFVCLLTLGLRAERAQAQACGNLPSALTPLGSPAGCSLCLNTLFPGAMEAIPGIPYYIESDLPERFCSTGVLYATVPILPPDTNGNPPLNMRTQVVSGGFTQVDGSFDVFCWHTVSGCSPASGERRLVVYVRNNGASDVQISPSQILLTDSTSIGMPATLGQRTLAGPWDVPIPSITIAAGTGDVVAYSKRFASSTNTSDRSTGTNCFGRVRALVPGAVPGSTNLVVYVIAIGAASTSQNKTLAETLLNIGAISGDTIFDLTVPPSGCANRRVAAAMTMPVWRGQPVTIDTKTLPVSGTTFRMTLTQTGSQACPLGQQTAPLVLHPGYTRNDAVGSYMKDFRMTLSLTNSDSSLPHAADLLFGESGADIGLAWQMVIGSSAATDAQVDAQPAQTGWAGPNQSATTRSLLGSPLTIAPCQTQVISLRFQVLGNSSLPFDLSVLPSQQSEYIVDNLDSGFASTGGWQSSATSGFYGTNSLVSTGAPGQSRATWTPALAQSGWFDVYAWWTASANRSPSTIYDIRNLDGVTSVIVNQQALGGQWNLLGHFPLTAGARNFVSFTNDVAAGSVVSADATRYVYSAPLDTIVDNTDPGFAATGTWSTSANSGYYGTNSLIHAGNSGNDTATWTASLPRAGRYDVYAWWVASSNRATAAPFTINHHFGAANVTANQVAGAGQWNLLGTFNFAQGNASVKLSDNVPSTQFVSADAIRFAFNSVSNVPQDADGDFDLDDADFASFSICMTGPDVAYAPVIPSGCAQLLDQQLILPADADRDGDVDQADFAALQKCFSGDGIAVATPCSQ